MDEQVPVHVLLHPGVYAGQALFPGVRGDQGAAGSGAVPFRAAKGRPVADAAGGKAVCVRDAAAHAARGVSAGERERSAEKVEKALR